MVESEHPAFFLSFAGGQGSGFTSGIGQTVEVGLVGNMQFKGFVFLQQILRELQRQQAGLLGKLAKTLLACLVEQRTTPHEAVVSLLQQHVFLRREFAMMVVDVLDACKKTAVQSYVVGMLCQDGAHLLSQRVEVVVGLGAQHVREHGGYAVQKVVVMVALRVVVA